jgi:hypothetical protein
MTSAYIADGKPRSVSFTLDEIGQIIRRDESGYISGQTGNPHEIWYRFSGRQMGYTGNNGTSDLSYDASVGDRRVVGPNSPGTFRNSQVYGGAYADFAQNYDPINSYYQGAAGGSYRVNQGDTLQRIAQSLYGDSSLWYKIAEANGLSAAAALVEGQTLVLPTGVLNAKNNAGTFKPYNAGEAIGDLSPSTPQPPKKPKCGVFGQILLAVIAIAVVAIAGPAIIGAPAVFGAGGAVTTAATGLTAVFGGAAAAAGSAAAIGAAVVGGAIAGAAGSVISQGVGVALGIQEKFSWKAVGLAAIGGAVGGGINAGFGKATDILGAVARGAAGNAITQGIGVATGLQNKFSWAGVAAAGIAAGVGFQVGKWLGATPIGPGKNDIGNYVANFGKSAASMIAHAATRSLAEGSDFGDNILASLPDLIALTVGDLIFDGVSENRQEAAQSVINNLPLDQVQHIEVLGGTLVALPDGTIRVEGLDPVRLEALRRQGAIPSTGAARSGAAPTTRTSTSVGSAAPQTYQGYDGVMLPNGIGLAFLDTGPAVWMAESVRNDDAGGINFEYRFGASPVESFWFGTEGDTGAVRILSNENGAYLYTGGTQAFATLGVRVSYGAQLTENVYAWASLGTPSRVSPSIRQSWSVDSEFVEALGQNGTGLAGDLLGDRYRNTTYRYRTTSGFGFRTYSNGWGGNQYARTHNFGTVFKRAGYVGQVYGAYDNYSELRTDGFSRTASVGGSAVSTGTGVAIGLGVGFFIGGPIGAGVGFVAGVGYDHFFGDTVAEETARLIDGR